MLPSSSERYIVDPGGAAVIHNSERKPIGVPYLQQSSAQAINDEKNTATTFSLSSDTDLDSDEVQRNAKNARFDYRQENPSLASLKPGFKHQRFAVSNHELLPEWSKLSPNSEEHNYEEIPCVFSDWTGDTPETLDQQNELKSDQETETEIHEVTFTWTIRDFSIVRDHAYMAALPHMQNFLESEEFGSSHAGTWYLMLFPNGEMSSKDVGPGGVGAGGGVVVKVVSCNKRSLTAKASFSLLDFTGQLIEGFQRAFDSFKWFQTRLYYNSINVCADDETDDLLDHLPHDVLRIVCNLQVCTAIKDVLPNSRISNALIHSTSLDLELKTFSSQNQCKDMLVLLLHPKSETHTIEDHHPSIASQSTAASPLIRSENAPVDFFGNNNFSTQHHKVIIGCDQERKSCNYKEKTTSNVDPVVLNEEDHHAMDINSRYVKASRFVLCARSKVLNAMLNGPFKEGGNKIDAIRLSDMSYEILEHLINFMHTDQCSLLENNNLPQHHGSTEQLEKVVELLEAADKYDVKSLKLRCSHWLSQQITSATLHQLYYISQRFKLKTLFIACTHYLQHHTSWKPLH